MSQTHTIEWIPIRSFPIATLSTALGTWSWILIVSLTVAFVFRTHFFNSIIYIFERYNILQ